MSVFVGFCCNFVLTILHLIFSLHLHLKFLKSMFSKFIDNISNVRVSRERKFHLDSELIAKNINSYSKIPKHITFALGHESSSYEDLIQIIVWTLSTKIPVLSFYDHKDELNAGKLYDVFNEHYPQLSSRIKWGVSFTKNLHEEDSNHYSLQVNVLTSKHGRQLLIDSIQELCHKKYLILTDRAATEAALDDIMLSKLSYSNSPDFLVISGYIYTTYGLSPWHLTFTEFLTIHSYKYLRTTDYIQIIANFANCEQKFGR